MVQYFKTLFEYDKWATDALLEKFEHQFPQNERIYQVLSHILSAQRLWLDRCLGLPQSVVVWGERLPDEIYTDAKNYNLAWAEFIGNLQPADLDKMITYTNTRGDTFTNKLVDIMAHVINHGTHHRGGIMVQMKEEGFVLPNIDYINFIRS